MAIFACVAFAAGIDRLHIEFVASTAMAIDQNTFAPRGARLLGGQPLSQISGTARTDGHLVMRWK
jgi:hypothetical protein